MPSRRLALQRPERCKYCQELGSVRLQNTVRGDVVYLSWACGACQREWPTTVGEAMMKERRGGLPDHRDAPRKDRRRA
jgi:hypothetical protein